MKAWFLTSFALVIFSVAFSQSPVPPYKQNKKLPVFEIETVGKGAYSTAKLKKNTPTLIMFFSPGCDHCIHQFEAMQKRMNDFKNYQIVMATYQPIEELAEFNKKYQIQKYPNIVTGRDANYFLPPFYEIANFPYMAFYDKNQQLVTTFEGNLSVDDMLKKFK
ncbi:MAG: redoxin domain-containing protein [Chitinophagaceae bacterium]|nr:redoxin domain-containing protein [Chitinophagaceae bacterium]